MAIAALHAPSSNRIDQLGNRLSQPLVFTAIFTLFTLIFAASWPIEWSFDLWILKDRASFLNLDYLLDQKLRLGVDTYYSYGLLPVAIQHALFMLAGRGVGPMMAMSIVHLVALAFFCTFLFRHLPQSPAWLAALLVSAPMILWVNPNFPYCLVQLSMLYALLLVLERRLDLALPVSMIGWASVPSLPLVLASLLFLLLLVNWALGQQRSPRRLALALAPGTVCLVLLGVGLSFEFGVASFVVTALPTLGIRLYRAAHYGLLTTGVEYLSPPNATLRYYLANGPAWWLTSSIVLVGLGCRSAIALLHERELEPRHLVIFLCAVLQIVFVLAAYGAPPQHVIYDPLLVLGMLVGISSLAPGRMRRGLLALFIGLSVLSSSGQVRHTWQAWRGTSPSATTLGLYARSEWVNDWSRILRRSTHAKVLFLSYGTGLHHYYPQIQSPDLWFMQLGQVFPSDEKRLLAQIDAAEIVVEDLTGPTGYIDADHGIQLRLKSMCLAESTKNVKVWTRRRCSA